jgi:hypothetical protein
MKRLFVAIVFTLLCLTGTSWGQFRQPGNPPAGPEGRAPPPGFRIAQNPPIQPGPKFVVQKVCGRCKQVVPDDSKTGDKCPFCGAKWTDEDGGSDQQKKSKTNISAPRSQTHAWDRIADTDSDTYGSFIWRWVVIGVGFVVSAIIVLYTVRFLKNNI